MKSTPQQRELISALVDGQLASHELALAMEAFKADTESATDGSQVSGCWNTYHAIGEVLRAPVAQLHGADAQFISRLNARLALEPAPLPEAGISADVARVHPATAANDGIFRWKVAAGFASLAAVTAVAWSSFGALSPATGPQLAQNAESGQILVASPQGTMVRDVRLEQLLAAHKQFGGTSALQVPSGFLRNATFEAPQDTGR